MLKQIAAAMKISLKECAAVEDPTEYTKAILGVLTRYKTNIFKMIYKDGEIWQDPKELIQFRIGTSFRTRAGFDKKPLIIDRNPIMLYINVLIPDPTGPVNKENVRNLAVRVCDVIDMDKLLMLTPDCYLPVAEQTGEYNIDIPGLYHNLDRGPDEVYTFTIQLNAGVDAYAEEEAYLIKSISMNGDPRLSLLEIRTKEDKERTDRLEAIKAKNRREAEESRRQSQFDQLRKSIDVTRKKTGNVARSFLG